MNKIDIADYSLTRVSIEFIIKGSKSICNCDLIVSLLNPLMFGGNKSSYVLKQTCCFFEQVCLSTYDLKSLDIEGLN